jgi:hypothetical protein
MGEQRKLTLRYESYINPNPKKNKIMIDLLIWSNTSFNRSWHIYIYTRLNIIIFMNRRILTKYDENLYSDSSPIRENQTLRFPKPEPWVFHPTASSKCINFLDRAINHVLHIYPFWSSQRVLRHGCLKFSVWVHLLVVSIISLFLE